MLIREPVEFRGTLLQREAYYWLKTNSTEFALTIPEGIAINAMVGKKVYVIGTGVWGYTSAFLRYIEVRDIATMPNSL